MTLRTVLWEARVVAGAVLLTLTAGCYSMARVPARYVTTEKPMQVVVRDADGAIFAINNPSIVQDSLVGSDGTDERVALNLREVDAMVVRKYSKPKTYGLIAGLTAGTSLIVLGGMQAGLLGDCFRIVNRNNQCASAVGECKYGACPTDPDAMP